MWQRLRLMPSKYFLQICRTYSTEVQQELISLTGLQSSHASLLIKSNSHMLASEWSNYINRLTDLGFSSSDRNILLRHNVSDITSTLSISRLNNVLQLFSALDIQNPCALLARDPWIAIKDSVELEKTINFFGEFLTKGEVRQLIRHHPVVLSLTADDITARFLYVIIEMQMSIEVMSTRCIWSVSLKTLRDRHTFLLRTGQYKSKTVRKQSVVNQRQTLNRFLSCNLENFVEKVAGVSMDEWQAFYKMQRTTETIWDFE